MDPSYPFHPSIPPFIPATSDPKQSHSVTNYLIEQTSPHSALLPPTSHPPSTFRSPSPFVSRAPTSLSLIIPSYVSQSDIPLVPVRGCVPELILSGAVISLPIFSYPVQLRLASRNKGREQLHERSVLL